MKTRKKVKLYHYSTHSLFNENISGPVSHKHTYLYARSYNFFFLIFQSAYIKHLIRQKKFVFPSHMRARFCIVSTELTKQKKHTYIYSIRAQIYASYKATHKARITHTHTYTQIYTEQATQRNKNTNTERKYY